MTDHKDTADAPVDAANANEAAAEVADEAQADTDAAAGAELEKVEQLRAEVERLQAALAEAEDKYLRAVAELHNYKRRSQREQAQRMQYANQELLAQVLPIMDNLQRALAHQAHAGSEEFARGVELVVRQFHDILASFGVQPVPAQGQPFDPQIHEAVAQVETTEVPEGTVVEVDTPGYCLHDRCLRPAKVVVAKAPKQAQADEAEGGSS